MVATGSAAAFLFKASPPFPPSRTPHARASADLILMGFWGTLWELAGHLSCSSPVALRERAPRPIFARFVARNHGCTALTAGAVIVTVVPLGRLVFWTVAWS